MTSFQREGWGYLKGREVSITATVWSQVVLNLEDVEEERELEELEDGRCGGDEEEEESADEAIEETDSITQPSSLPQHTCSHR